MKCNIVVKKGRNTLFKSTCIWCFLSISEIPFMTVFGLVKRAIFRISDISSWRFDNVHLNRFGNKRLFEAVIKKLEI